MVTDTRRFISPQHPQPGFGPFPFTANSGNPNNDNVNDGVWDTQNGGPMNATNVSYDADPDGDGYKEAIWLDLGYPVQVRENADGTTTKFVPMFAITMYDADALFNLNAHGNVAGITAFQNAYGTFGPLGPGPDGQFGTADDQIDLRYASQSNQGVAVSEVNPGWGMTATTGEGPTVQHQRFYGHTPQNTVELANMEWWWLTSGRADYDATANIQNLYPGRFGEVSQLNTALTNGYGPFQFPSAGNSFLFPSAGIPVPGFPGPANFSFSNPNHVATDDNLSGPTGGSYTGNTFSGIGYPANIFPLAMQFPAWQQPLDLHGTGRYTAAVPAGSNNYGKQRLTKNAGQHKWPAYSGYQDTNAIGLYANANTQFLVQPQNYPGYTPRYDVDEPEETILEPAYARSDIDSIFGAGETATLHLSTTDQQVLGLSGRVRDLAPINFDGGNVTATEDRRKKFTTVSWDLKSFGITNYNSGFAPVAARAWEFSGAPDTFPPLQSVFRGPVQQLLFSNSPPNLANFSNLNMRKLSINHLCDFDFPGLLANQRQVIFRPLTPHPVGLPPGVVNQNLNLTNPANPANPRGRQPSRTATIRSGSPAGTGSSCAGTFTRSCTSSAAGMTT